MVSTRKEIVQKSKQAKQEVTKIPIPGLKGKLEHLKDFASELVRPRPVDIWFPENYEADSTDRFPVIYMHDGQMIFHHEDSSLAGMDLFWDVDKTITKLTKAKKIRPAIVVAVWMSDWAKGARGAEFMPQKAVPSEVWKEMLKDSDSFATEMGGESISSDNYLRFFVEELKPFVDNNYRTLTSKNDTFIAGSSMGGLISAYAIAEYPDIFGGAACLSTDWSIGDGIVVDWFNKNWPTARGNRVYFDYGTETFDSLYEPYQLEMDKVMRKYGYLEDKDWVTRRFEGDDHHPKAWRERFHIPLEFLLGTKN